MTKQGKEKLVIGVVAALVTGGLAVATALLTKPPVTNIVLPGGESVSIAGITSDHAEPTTTNFPVANVDTINVTLKLENGKRYSAEASKDPDTAPLLLIDGAGSTTFYFEEIKNIVVYSIIPSSNLHLDLVAAYREGAPLSLEIGEPFLVAFDTNQGIFYVKTGINYLF